MATYGKICCALGRIVICRLSSKICFLMCDLCVTCVCLACLVCSSICFSVGGETDSRLSFQLTTILCYVASWRPKTWHLVLCIDAVDAVDAADTAERQPSLARNALTHDAYVRDKYIRIYSHIALISKCRRAPSVRRNVGNCVRQFNAFIAACQVPLARLNPNVNFLHIDIPLSSDKTERTFYCNIGNSIANTALEIRASEKNPHL